MRVGKIRTKLAEMLSDEFKKNIQPEDIWKQSPYLVTYVGCALWGVDIDGLCLYSWSTMSECVKNGFVHEEDEDSNPRHRRYEIFSKKGDK